MTIMNELVEAPSGDGDGCLMAVLAGIGISTLIIGLVWVL